MKYLRKQGFAWGAQSRGLIRIFDFFSADQQPNIPRVFSCSEIHDLLVMVAVTTRADKGCITRATLVTDR